MQSHWMCINVIGRLLKNKFFIFPLVWIYFWISGLSGYQIILGFSGSFYCSGLLQLVLVFSSNNESTECFDLQMPFMLDFIRKYGKCNYKVSQVVSQSVPWDVVKTFVVYYCSLKVCLYLHVTLKTIPWKFLGIK